MLADGQGNYSISLTPGGSQSLEFTFIGFLQQTVAAKGKSVLNIVLKEDKVALSEVVVMGYTTQKKAALTGAVGTVDMADLDQRRVADFAHEGCIVGI